MSNQVVMEWVIKGLFALWCVALIKIPWPRYGFNRFLVGSFISSTIAVLVYQYPYVARHKLGMAFFETGEDPVFGSGELSLSVLAMVVAIALLIIGIWQKSRSASSKKNSDSQQQKWKMWQKLIGLLLLLPLLYFLLVAGGILAFLALPLAILNYHIWVVIAVSLLLCSFKADKRILLGLLFLIPLHISMFYGHAQAWAIAEKNSLRTGMLEVIDTSIQATEIQKWMGNQTSTEPANNEGLLLKIDEISEAGWAVDKDSLPSGITYLGEHALEVSFHCKDFLRLAFDYPGFGDRWTMNLVYPPEKVSQAAKGREPLRSEDFYAGGFGIYFFSY